MNDQVTASIMPRAASARFAARVRICSAVRILRVDRVVAAERLRRDVVDAMDAHDLLDEIGLAVDIRPPGRHCDIDESPASFGPKPRRLSMSRLSALGTSMPVSRFTSDSGKDTIFGS